MRRVLRAYLVLLGLALAVVLVRAQVTGGSVGAALTGGLLRSLAGGALAASVAFAALAPLRAVTPSVPELPARYVLGWVGPGVAFALGAWGTALLTVRTLPPFIDLIQGPTAWLLVAVTGATAGAMCAKFVWSITWLLSEDEAGEGGRDPGAEEAAAAGWRRVLLHFRRPRTWVVAGALVAMVVIGSRLNEGPTLEERNELQATREYTARMYAEQLRRAAPAGTPAADYVEAAARAVYGWESRWHGPPLTHRLSDPFLLGTPTFEVVFREGRVAGYRIASGPAAAPRLPADSAARLLSLPDSAPIFADAVEGREEAAGEAEDEGRP